MAIRKSLQVILDNAPISIGDEGVVKIATTQDEDFVMIQIDDGSITRANLKDLKKALDEVVSFQESYFHGKTDASSITAPVVVKEKRVKKAKLVEENQSTDAEYDEDSELSEAAGVDKRFNKVSFADRD